MSNVNKTEETIRDESGLMVIVIEWNEHETNNEEEKKTSRRRRTKPTPRPTKSSSPLASAPLRHKQLTRPKSAVSVFNRYRGVNYKRRAD